MFVPCAGLGTRLIPLGTQIPKPLISIGNKPLIHRVFDKYPNGTRFVVALGYQADLVKQVVSEISKELNIDISFTYSDSWRDKTNGLTQTILDSRSLLIEPFIFHAVDTLIDQESLEFVINQGENTAFFGIPKTAGTYRNLEDGKWNKKAFNGLDSEYAYIGISYISKTKQFFEHLQNSADCEAGETAGFVPNSFRRFNLPNVDWIDCGTPEGVKRAQFCFGTEDVVLPRKDEAIWQIGNHMYKFHIDEEFITNRTRRSKLLGDFVPATELVARNLYRYERINGFTLSLGTKEDFADFLEFCVKFWVLEKSLKEYEDKAFLKFYKDKTLKRVEDYLQIEGTYKVTSINGRNVRPIKDLLNVVDWHGLSFIWRVRAHGDLHPDNVLVVRDNEEGFALLDWRQDIAGQVIIEGDLYYEVGKIYHGLIVDHGVISKNAFQVSINGSVAQYELYRRGDKTLWIEILRTFCFSNGIDWKRVELVTALIFLNIAPLHHEVYRELLFVLGHKMLDEILD